MSWFEKSQTKKTRTGRRRDDQDDEDDDEGYSVENHLHYICIPVSVVTGFMGVIATL
jgi:hypothetical protein